MRVVFLKTAAGVQTKLVLHDVKLCSFVVHHEDWDAFVCHFVAANTEFVDEARPPSCRTLPNETRVECNFCAKRIILSGRPLSWWCPCSPDTAQRVQ